ncbi:hypothetical protein [Bradyrhizobium genomosp. I (2014)]|uniref:hypothetical protein n=1 Tax=Bradyrhizobium genomosp. I (2014) TaxID=2683269 RepID=UPI00054DCBD1|nr:hypothetical protein [Bradyrhizobium sp. CCBAU 43298]
MGKDLDDRKLGGNQRAEGMEQGRIAGIDCDSDLMTLFAPVNSATLTKEPNCMRRGGLAGAGITALMSREAVCYDNAPMESFLHTLVRHRNHNRADAQRIIFAFIEGFYEPNPAPFRHRYIARSRWS